MSHIGERQGWSRNQHCLGLSWEPFPIFQDPFIRLCVMVGKDLISSGCLFLVPRGQWGPEPRLRMLPAHLPNTDPGHVGGTGLGSGSELGKLAGRAQGHSCAGTTVTICLPGKSSSPRIRLGEEEQPSTGNHFSPQNPRCSKGSLGSLCPAL